MKKLTLFAFAIAAAIGFSLSASARTVPTQDAAASGGAQTNGFGLSLGKPPVVSANYCLEGASSVAETWLNNGASEDAADAAFESFYNNCMCAKKYAEYCT